MTPEVTITHYVHKIYSRIRTFKKEDLSYLLNKEEATRLTTDLINDNHSDLVVKFGENYMEIVNRYFEKTAQ